MSSHVQQKDSLAGNSHTQRLRVVPVAAVLGILSAVILLLLQFPLLVGAGLWLLSLALVLIVYAFYAQRRSKIEAWHIAIAGQIMGLLGIVLLFIASLTA